MSDEMLREGYCRDCGTGPLRMPEGAKVGICPACKANLTEVGLDTALAARIRKGTPLGLKEFSDLTGYSVQTLQAWIDKGVLQSVRVDGSSWRRIPPAEAERIGRELKLC